MSKFQIDLFDMEFNLFEYNRVQDYTDMDEGELKEIIREFHNFARDEIYPSRMQGDIEGVKRTPEGVKVPSCFHGVNEKYFQNGWFALGYPEDIGGVPVPHLANLVKVSLENSANMAWSLYPGLTRAALNVILKIGNEEQKKTYVEKMLTGSWGGTMCLTEPNAGSDVGAAKTSAKPVKDGKYMIAGTKTFISSGENDLYENIIHLVLARTPKASPGTKGLSLFLVPRFKIGSAGKESNDVHCSKVEEKMGIHGSATCEMIFGGEGKCEGYLIGKEFSGMENMFLMMNEARLWCGSQGEGQAHLAFGLSLQYAKQRVQFSQPIIDHPDVQRMLLKMRAACRGMRALLFYTAKHFDCLEHDKGDKEQLDNQIALLTPICKSWCTDQGFAVSVDAIQIHGGYGYCTEYGIEQFARDSKIATIYEGTNGIQAIDFLTRKVLRDEGATLLFLLKKIEKSLEEVKNEWKEEILLIKKSLKDTHAFLKYYKDLAKNKKVDIALASAMDFLNFCSNLIVAWLLFEHAKLAKKKQKEDPYYHSKVVDFKVFCRHYLVLNTALSQSIFNFTKDKEKMVL